MIQQSHITQSRNEIDHVLQELSMYVQRDERLRQVFINLGQALASEIHTPDKSLPAIKDELESKIYEEVDVSELQIGNAIISTAEVKPNKKHYRNSTVSKKKQNRKSKNDKEHPKVVLQVRDLLGSIKRITFAGQGSHGEERPKNYKTAFGVDVSWVRSRKRSSHQNFAEKVLATNPELVVQSTLGIGHKESDLIKKNCKMLGIPYVIVRSFGGVNILAHEIMKQASEQIKKTGDKNE
jgi:hypothetical protein